MLRFVTIGHFVLKITSCNCKHMAESLHRTFQIILLLNDQTVKKRNHSEDTMGLSAQSFVFFISSPLHDSLEPGSCCTSHSAGMADASPSPETSPSQLPRHNKTLLRFILPSARLYITNLPETEQPTKVDPLITLGAHVCLPRKGGDASS